jgi:pimeloyl-ACP methyl ester carboxylesterase
VVPAVETIPLLSRMTNNLATIAVTAAAIVVAASVMQAQIDHPTPTGPYAVGRQAFVWTDSTRREPTDTTRWRQVSAFVWYPAAVHKGAEAQVSLPPEWETLRLESLRTKLGPDIANAMREFSVHAQTNATLLPASSRLPVLLFTPGLSWLATDYSVLIENLVSHGYIVVGFSPTGFSNPVVFPDGRVVGQTLGNGASIATEQHYIEEDALLVLREIRQLDAQGFLRGRVDLGRIGAFGHSIGGATSFAIAARDTAIRAAINIDGDVMGDVREVRPHQPLLLINSDLPTPEEFPSDWPAKRVELTRQGFERSEKRRTDEWTALSSESASANRVRINGTLHLNFTDAALVSARAQPREARWMKFGSIDPDRGLTITSELVRSFFDQVFGRARVGDSFKSTEAHLAEVKVE